MSSPSEPALPPPPGARRPGVLPLVFDREIAVIGDIHGRADLLQRLLAALPPDIPIVVTGDIGDRGPDTRTCVDILIRRGAKGARGNHEQWLIAWANGEGFDTAALSWMMGGRATLDSYGVTATRTGAIEADRGRVPEAHRRWLGELAIVCDLDVMGHRYWIVHAGVGPDAVDDRVPAGELVPLLAATQAAALLWRKTEPSHMPVLDRPVIMGHVPNPTPRDLGHVIAIDTGSGTFPNGSLTAVILPERRFVGVR